MHMEGPSLRHQEQKAPSRLNVLAGRAQGKLEFSEAQRDELKGSFEESVKQLEVVARTRRKGAEWGRGEERRGSDWSCGPRGALTG